MPARTPGRPLTRSCAPPSRARTGAGATWTRSCSSSAADRVSTWIFEPGYTEAELRARHMIVTWVRGLFKDIRGSVEWDRESFERTTFEGRMEASRIWTGEEARDEHLRSPDFFDVETHPLVSFEARFTDRVGDIHFRAVADLATAGRPPRCRSTSPISASGRRRSRRAMRTAGRCGESGSRRAPASTATTSASPGTTSCPV